MLHYTQYVEKVGIIVERFALIRSIILSFSMVSANVVKLEIQLFLFDSELS